MIYDVIAGGLLRGGSLQSDSSGFAESLDYADVPHDVCSKVGINGKLPSCLIMKMA